jgi:hypothetical protein
MLYCINEWWLILLVFTPFILGLLTGISHTYRKFLMKAMKKLPLEEFNKLVDDKHEV